MPETIFVTGGNGFIGSVVVRKLVERGYRVRCLLRKTSNTDRIADLDYEAAYGDVRDYASLERAAQGCAGIVHLASLSSWADIHSPQMREVVLTGTANVLRAAELAKSATGGKQRVVFVSSVIAVGGSAEPKVLDENAKFDLDDRKLVYARYKREAEALCQQANERGVPTIIVNPAEVYGPNDTGMITAKNLIDFARSWPVLVSRGGTAVVHVEDVAAGVVAAFEKGRAGERYILGGDNLSIRELALLSNEIAGKRKLTLTFPNFVLRALAFLAEKLKLPMPFEPAVIPYATRYWYYDNKKAQSELGVQFRPARAVLEPTVQWLKEAGHI
jgi:dihydroflavonol-4-reductase